ncbi:MAG TPA: amidohydrolase family protein [Thermoanaerobaculia bacterium]|nr:amidohydrolase family protein [Thermoanaerobaculia bacterium]
MKVFDAHVHIQPWQMLKPAALALMNDDAHRDVAAILERPENLLRHLDGNGVERICCINYVSPDVMGFTAAANDWIARYTDGHRDRLLPVGSVNPLHCNDVAGEIERVLDLGIRMIKIHPPHQLFSPNDYRGSLPDLAHIYRACETRRIPVMFHTGTSVFPGARNVYADPMPIDDVAVDFPELQIVLAHGGRPLYGETAFFLVRRHPNVRLELSGIPPKSILRFFPRLAEIADKVLWGTDWPSPGVVSMRKNIDDFLQLGLPEAATRKILSDNANQLFGT